MAVTADAGHAARSASSSLVQRDALRRPSRRGCAKTPIPPHRARVYPVRRSLGQRSGGCSPATVTAWRATRTRSRPAACAAPRGSAGWPAARRPARYAGRAADLTRSEEQRRAAAEKRQLQAAERILDVLGQMKGAAMKLGQVASFVDTGALPKEAHERLEAKLAKLRDSAPRVSFEQMRKVIESDLERPLEDVVRGVRARGVRRRLDRPGLPRAAARRPAGRGQGAVPGDRQRRARGRAEPRPAAARWRRCWRPGWTRRRWREEIRERLTEELDYEVEAQTHRAFARTWRGHPFVVIPRRRHGAVGRAGAGDGVHGRHRASTR